MTRAMTNTNPVDRVPRSRILETIAGDHPDGYNVDGGVFRRFLEETGERNFTEETLPRFKEWLKAERYSAATINRRVVAIRQRMRNVLDRADLSASKRYAIERSLSAVKSIRKPPQSVRPDEVISPEEWERLRDGCTDDKTRCLMEFLWSTGTRISEALNVQTGDIRQNGRGVKYAEVRISGKGETERYVFVSVDLVRRIKAAYGGTRWIFQSPGKDEPYKRSRAYQKISWWTAYVLGKKASPHTFRHSFATRLIQEHKPLPAVSKYLGHSSVAVTSDFYVHDTLNAADVMEVES